MEFCWITNLGVVEFVVVVKEDDEDEEELVIMGWTTVTRFFLKNEVVFELLFKSFVVDKSFPDEINVCSLDEFVPGGIKVTTGGELFDEFVCWGLKMNVFDAENPPFVVDDFSKNCTCNAVGGEDFPVVDVSKRNDDWVVDGVVVGVVVDVCFNVEDKFFVGFSPWGSADERKRKRNESFRKENFKNIFTER